MVTLREGTFEKSEADLKGVVELSRRGPKVLLEAVKHVAKRTTLH